ncbi:hypothetical protein Plec18167_004626 [Paecilomyces lecythidis]|uniref:Uncharacterized protein n=1 Tax=Paecilomyces lecythidis TaxID=3004212 RepID=A0ABR3XNU0_9EURO
MAISQTSASGPAASSEAGPRSQSQLDPALKHFADPSFDPVDLINDALPPLVLASSQAHAARSSDSVPLSELSSQTQSLLSQWSAQNVRLSNILTQLTDEILRSSGRLAYEVEVLRGEALGLSDALTESLHGDIQKFVPEGLAENLAQTNITKGTANSTDLEETEDDQAKQKNGEAVSDPEYITKLRTLGQVRSRLEDVVHLFGEAMEWQLPPSELSIASSFISVSAPEPPGWESHSQEEKGQEIARKLRGEITELLDSDGGGEAGLEAARKRVEKMRELATVWKGSVEERARNRFVDGLENMVEDRRKVLERQLKERERRDEPRRQRSQRKNRSSMDQGRDDDSGGPAGGLFRNLQRLRDEIYLE